MIRRFCLLLLSAVLPLFCQTERGNITGQVRDASGAGIPGAELIATHVSTGLQTKTQSTAAGDYNIPIQPGRYRVTVTAAGFKRYLHDNVIVATSSTVRLDAVLEIGAVSESVEVKAEVAQIQSHRQTVSARANAKVNRL